MKKLLLVFALAALLTPAVVVAQTQKQEVGVQQRDRDMMADPEGETVRNQNEVQTQNQGEADQMEVATQERERMESDNADSKSQASRQNMSMVAEKVEGLLVEGMDGGIGSQVREIAKAQQQAQNKIKLELSKLEAKKGLMRMLFGPNIEAVDNLNQQMEQNRLRIQELRQLATQVENKADETQIQEAVEALVAQNTALQDQVKFEEGNLGVFGWIWRLFRK